MKKKRSIHQTPSRERKRFAFPLPARRPDRPASPTLDVIVNGEIEDREWEREEMKPPSQFLIIIDVPQAGYVNLNISGRQSIIYLRCEEMSESISHAVQRHPFLNDRSSIKWMSFQYKNTAIVMHRRLRYLRLCTLLCLTTSTTLSYFWKKLLSGKWSHLNRLNRAMSL